MSLSKQILLFMSFVSCTNADAHLTKPGINGSLMVDDSRIQRRDPVEDCKNGIYHSSCWNTLGLTQWLSDWDTTTELCTTSKTNSCRAVDELWTDAFLRIAKDEPRGSSCVKLHACLIEAVPDLKDIRPDESEVDRIRYQYILYNIYGEIAIASLFTARLDKAVAINSFLVTGTRCGTTPPSRRKAEIVNIVQTIDQPNKKSRVLLHDILSALTAGLAFPAIPKAAALAGAAATIAPIFLKTIQQAPGVAKIIWPLGTVEREIIEIGALGSQLAKVTAAFSDRISQALASVMGRDESDQSAFLAFAQDGAFPRSADRFPDIANDTRGLLIGFTTYFVSETLVLTGWHAVVLLDTDRLWLTSGSTTCPRWVTSRVNGYWRDERQACPQVTGVNYGDVQCSAYDGYGQCKDSYWWYSDRTRAALTLAKPPYYGVWSKASKEEKDPTLILHTIFANGWSTGQLLLENAGRCVVVTALYELLGKQHLSDYVVEYIRGDRTLSVILSSNCDYLETTFWLFREITRSSLINLST
ncbi:MAG: hypothetical protein Q9207_006836 [Kuettlingeria erythrocarpa]